MSKSIKDRLLRIVKAEYFRNVMVLFTGNSVARFFPILVTPLLTRLYTPAQFTLLGVYTSILTIAASIATGQYEWAVILPEDDRRAAHLLVLSCGISLCYSFLLAGVFAVYGENVRSLFAGGDIGNVIHFIPGVVFVVAAVRSLQQWLIRQKRFRQLTFSTVVQTSGQAAVQIVLGFAGLGLGLIFGNMVGFMGAFLFILLLLFTSRNKGFAFSAVFLKDTMVAYKHFPLYRTFSVLLNTSTAYLPVIIFARYFDQNLVGYYSLCIKVLGLPIILIARAVSDVFSQKAAREFTERGECMSTFRYTLKFLFFTSFPLLLLLFIFAPFLFRVVFGQNWEPAGGVVRILIPMYLLRFISSPLSRMFIISERLKIDLYWQISLFILGIGGTIVVARYAGFNMTLGYFSAAYSFLYIVSFAVSRGLARGKPD